MGGERRGREIVGRYVRGEGIVEFIERGGRGWGLRIFGR